LGRTDEVLALYLIKDEVAQQDIEPQLQFGIGQILDMVVLDIHYRAGSARGN
jgi:hypothetical protein